MSEQLKDKVQALITKAANSHTHANAETLAKLTPEQQSELEALTNFDLTNYLEDWEPDEGEPAKGWKAFEPLVITGLLEMFDGMEGLYDDILDRISKDLDNQESRIKQEIMKLANPLITMAGEAYWDELQQQGNRRDYTNMFSTKMWTDEYYNPKYDIEATSLYRGFWETGITDTKVDIRVTTDKGSAATTQAFSNSAIQTIKKFIINDTSSPSSYNSSICPGAFNDCTQLKHCIFEGEIKGNFYMQHCWRLDEESLASIINCLAAKPTYITAWTLFLGNDNIRKLTEQQISQIAQKGWVLK